MTETKKCYIFCAAPIADYAYLNSLPFENSLIICADGGIQHTARLGLRPDIWVGDHDSRKLALPDGVECHTYPTDKDFTDTNLAIDLALERGYGEIVFLGALGGRLDHEFSHYSLLKYLLERGGSGTLLDAHNEITMVFPSAFRLYKNEKKYVSFFPFGDRVEGLCIKGLKYEVENFCLDNGKVQASCNEFEDKDTAEISFTKGCLLIMRCEDAK